VGLFVNGQSRRLDHPSVLHADEKEKKTHSVYLHRVFAMRPTSSLTTAEGETPFPPSPCLSLPHAIRNRR